MSDNSDPRDELRTEIKALADGIEEEHDHADGDIDIHRAIHETVDSSPFVFQIAKSYDTLRELRLSPIHADEPARPAVTHCSSIDGTVQKAAFDLLRKEVRTLLRQRDNGINV